MRETKQMGGHWRPSVEVKRATRNGIEVSIIEGYIATFAPDTGGIFGIPDRFAKGAFLDSLQEHRDRGDRQIRLKDHHHHTIGGFPIETAIEDATGLFAVGEINLETQLGREADALIRQNVLVDMSIGFSSEEETVEDGVRVITKALVWEGSVVDEPANQGAQIVSVKSLDFQDLPLASQEAKFDVAGASDRVRGDSRAYIFQEADNKILIADLIDDELVAIPAAIRCAALLVKDLPEEKQPDAICHVERYFQKMNLPSPFPVEQRQFIGVDEARAFSTREFEAALTKSGAFSNGAARYLARSLPATPQRESYDQDKLKAIHQSLVEARKMIG